MASEHKDYRRVVAKTHKLLDFSKNMSLVLHTDEILLDLRDAVLDLCEAEKTTIFALADDGRELYSKVKDEDGLQEIRVPLSNDSIAGYAARSGKVVNIADVYDPEQLNRYKGLKFDDSWDRQSGYRTRSLMAVPLVYQNTGTQGVLEVINRKNGETFNRGDLRVALHVAQSLAVAFSNVNRFRKNYHRYFHLLATRKITLDQLTAAEEQADREEGAMRGDVPGILVRDFGVSKKDMGASLARHHQTRFVEFSETRVPNENLLIGLNAGNMRKEHWLPLFREGDTVTVLMDDPSDQDKKRNILNLKLALQYKFWVSLRQDVLAFIDLAVGMATMPLIAPVSLGEIESRMGGERDEQDDCKDEDVLDEKAPAIVQLVNRILVEAYEKGVSDVHVEPKNNLSALIRFRKDGVCYKYHTVVGHTRAIVNRIKIMANLRVDERRVAQSGKIKMKYGRQTIELRVETTPTVAGIEDVVMRVLASGQVLPLDRMKFSDRNLEAIMRIARQPYGILLVVGPTGSGKTTTLHSVLAHLNTPDKKIWTAEDPVEITQEGLRQVQINPNLKEPSWGFADALRSFLRADPDVIMVGEMRDAESARIAVEASLTGHFVLSTLHTNSAPETITRLLYMGVNPLNLADALLGVLAQRLVRTLCPECKREYRPDVDEIQRLREEYGRDFADELSLDEKTVLFSPVGCPACENLGHRGRIGVHELLDSSRPLKQLIREEAGVEKIREQALKEGMRTLKMDGLRKAVLGTTTLEQVVRVCGA